MLLIILTFLSNTFEDDDDNRTDSHNDDDDNRTDRDNDNDDAGNDVMSSNFQQMLQKKLKQLELELEVG